LEPLLNSTEKLKPGEYDYVVGNTYTVVTAMVSWILWRVCHYQPDSPIAGGCGCGAGT
jgi:hypothetical protein